MNALAILNIVLVVLIVAAIVSLLGWSIIADKARLASRPRPARAKTTRTSREPAGQMRGYTA